MQLRFSEEDEAFRREFADWLAQNLRGEFEAVRGRGGPGDENAFFDERLAWEKRLGEAGWTCIAWPEAHGGRGASLAQQVVYHEEYARAGGPGRVGHIGETLLGPTLIAFGTEAQQQRFLPAIQSGEELWCQGYSEPNAGSDLANVQTRARLEDDAWVLDGQKVWTSLAEWSQWAFVLCRTDPEAPKHKGLSYLLVPMDQPGVEIRPIQQITGDSEFSETFFDGARTDAANIVGEPGEGWKVANGTLAFERGASTLGQNILFQNELDHVIEAAKRNGRAQDPGIRQRIAEASIGLEIFRYNALRVLSQAGSELPPAALINKIYWATWHRDLGELAMDVLGPEAQLLEAAPYELTRLQRLFLFSRSDTIYAGSNQIQRNIIAERALGLPREPRAV
ncbi:MAG: acyl-CoA dehydrogenase family protein [Myxococcales bacterium]|nr:acyl-CoA dehydrogenase family protein [Myxococcales bacterium]